MIRSSWPSNHSTSPLRVGIVGLGRSGWNIHAKTLGALPGRFHIAAVVDPVAERCDEARQTYGSRVHDSFESMVTDELDLIVVASPNHLHTDHAVAAMAAGKHVVCEKPFALSVGEADRAIAAAIKYGRVLSPFQHRRYEAHFQKVCALIDEGVLGEIVNIRMVWHQFTRRWDWQTLARYGGGLLNNNGSHLLDHALQMLPDDVEPEVFADLRQVLTLGDTEDHVKIVLKAPGHPTLDVELTNACAFPQDRWLVMGRLGGLRGTEDRLEWCVTDWAEQPKRQLETQAVTERQYAKDNVTWTRHEWTPPAEQPHAYVRYYEDLYQTLRCGRPLVIEPQSVRRLIRTLERCYEQCAAMATSQ